MEAKATVIGTMTAVEKATEANELSRSGQEAAVVPGGEIIGGQGNFVTAAPVALSELVGAPPRLYEKNLPVQVAFEPTPSYCTALRPFSNLTTRWLFAVLLIARICWGVAARAHAEEANVTSQPTWAVEIAADSACANDPAFRERLSASIPERQRAPLAVAELRARVGVAPDHRATLSVFDQLTQREAGQRQIALPRGGCNEAAEALALVIAVMVEAGRSLLPAPEVPAEPPPEPPPEPKPGPADDQVDQKPSYKRPERYAWQGPPAGHDLAFQVGVGIGLLPSESLGGSLGWGIRGSRIWPVWIHATGWLSQESADQRARIGAAYGTLSICPLSLNRPAIRVRLCPGLAAGAMWAEAHNLPAPTNDVSFLTLGSLAGAAHVRLFGSLELVLEARMEVPFSQLQFVYSRADGATPQIHETSVVTGSFFGGLGLRFR